jgi:hypothetical protein
VIRNKLQKAKNKRIKPKRAKTYLTLKVKINAKSVHSQIRENVDEEEADRPRFTRTSQALSPFDFPTNK